MFRQLLNILEKVMPRAEVPHPHARTGELLRDLDCKASLSACRWCLDQKNVLWVSLAEVRVDCSFHQRRHFVDADVCTLFFRSFDPL